VAREIPLATPSFSASVQNKPFFDLQEINSAENGFAMSIGGKTAGVLLVTNNKTARPIAALKLVNENEIFANNLFSMLNLPTPKFDIIERKEFSDNIQQKFHCQSKEILKYEKIMAMEFVEGRTMSQHSPLEIKNLLFSDNNLRFLGMSMVLDMFIGNADRSIYFQLPKLNAENIMFKNNNSVVFIDQAFTSRKGRLKPLLVTLEKSANAQSGSKDCIYKKFVEPLVKNSFQRNNQNEQDELKKNPLRILSDKELNPENLLGHFNDLINEDQKLELDINKKVSLGILDAVNLLVANKENILNLAVKHKKYDDVESNYAELESTLNNFKVKNYDENI
jgi:hypothetical protein